MVNHHDCNPESKGFCDSLYESLRLFRPDIVRKEAISLCAFSSESGTVFLYVTHAKSPNIRLDFLWKKDLELAKWKLKGFDPKLKKKIGKWQENLPFSIKLSKAEHVVPIALFLSNESYIQSQRVHKEVADFDQPIEPISQYFKYTEGEVQQKLLKIYKRNVHARAKCIEIHGAKCFICGFDFGKRFGDQFKHTIHVHHKNPISIYDVEHDVDPENDLVPVCPNCHSVIHKTDPPYTIEDVAEMIKDPS